jgi:hypothetical protein
MTSKDALQTKTPGTFPGVLFEQQWRKCMGIEPTWDSLHCPTPDLKSGSPTSELGTSGCFITDTAIACRGLFGIAPVDCHQYWEAP